MTIADIQNNVYLVQNSSEVEEFNKDYNEDFDYYFIVHDENHRPIKLYGSYSVNLNSTIYLVSNSI